MRTAVEDTFEDKRNGGDKLAYQQRWKTWVARGYLELSDRYSGGRAINPETMDMPVARGGAGSDFLYDALVTFKARFDPLEWRMVETLYRPDVPIDGATAKRLGWALQAAWKRVEPDVDYFKAVLRSYEKLVG